MTLPPHRFNRLAAAVASGVLLALAGAPPVLADSDREHQWHLRALHVAEAHKISQGEGVTVAVIDSGVQANHRDLTGNILPGVDFLDAKTKGWVDTNGHGTAMAGLIAGHGHGAGDADGALGIAPKAKILPIRGQKDNKLSSVEIADAITEAVRHHVGVISMSFATSADEATKRALQQAIDADIVLVAASGNRPDDIFLPYPAKYPGVVAVGATGRDGKLAPVTTTGPEMVLVAPGVQIVSTANTGGYRTGTGTSDSTAIVAGAAALIRAKYPNLSAAEVVHRLTATATDKGAPGRDREYGYGSLDLVAALTADVPAGAGQPSAAPSSSAVALPDPTTDGDTAAAPSTPKAAPVNWTAIGVVVAVLLIVIGVMVGLPTWLILRSRRHRKP
ncbi:type VII secretion-associated serine protease mycosin [Krasilnikovia cinnamomea]|uniref:Type VII secretion-associated serine protease mycosin n=1 Tax=Krasilnikovia cinnamomea TaxID=349313 RepID=A0A4V2G756_9ACTN|nr:S8 family serine peptidase [Krasilnikovia cinnamomea]RZU51266.1 type VII secretion-associated serine protease mycosin [Krasilnikovia cinnamomea]